MVWRKAGEMHSAGSNVWLLNEEQGEYDIEHLAADSSTVLPPPKERLTSEQVKELVIKHFDSIACISLAIDDEESPSWELVEGVF